MRPIHPGEILREEFIIPLGLSAHALAVKDVKQGFESMMIC
jgi:plasmid maintenance system antidote protein VapI